MSQSFWNFSLLAYREMAVQNECLHLQDQFGLDVNLVLFCAFAGAIQGVTLTPDDVLSAMQAVQKWHEEIVRPLRAARRNLKPFETGQEALAAYAAKELRTQVKAAELDSERIEQMVLEQWGIKQLSERSRGHSPDAVIANLKTLLAVHDIGPEELAAENSMPHLIAAALRASST